MGILFELPIVDPGARPARHHLVRTAAAQPPHRPRRCCVVAGVLLPGVDFVSTAIQTIPILAALRGLDLGRRLLRETLGRPDRSAPRGVRELRHVVAPIVYEADWVVPVEGEPVREGGVAVADGRIVAVGPAAELEGERRRFDDAVIVPAFVNAHSHLEYAVYAGFGDTLSFAPWIALHIQRKAPAARRGRGRDRAPRRRGVPALGDRDDRGRQLHGSGRASVRRARAARARGARGVRRRPGRRARALREPARGHRGIPLRPRPARGLPACALQRQRGRLRRVRRPRSPRRDALRRERGRAGVAPPRHRPRWPRRRACRSPRPGETGIRLLAGRGLLGPDCPRRTLRPRGGRRDRAPRRARRGGRPLPALERHPRMWRRAACGDARRRCPRRPGNRQSRLDAVLRPLRGDEDGRLHGPRSGAPGRRPYRELGAGTRYSWLSARARARRPRRARSPPESAPT